MKDSASNWNQTLTAQAREHGRHFFGVAFSILRDAAAAEDACQQALLKAWQQEDSIREAAHLRAWLTRVVVNESLLQLRKQKRERQVLSQHPQPATSAASTTREASSPWISVPTRTAGPADLMADREAVRLALDELPEPTRTIVVLRVMAGHSGNEVKAMLDCSAAEVSRRLHAGMEQLRGIFSRQEYDR